MNEIRNRAPRSPRGPPRAVPGPERLRMRRGGARGRAILWPQKQAFRGEMRLENSSISSCCNDTLSSTASGTGTVVKLPHQAILDPHPCLPDASCRSLHVIICAHVACVWGVCDTGEFISNHRMLY